MHQNEYLLLYLYHAFPQHFAHSLRFAPVLPPNFHQECSLHPVPIGAFACSARCTLASFPVLPLFALGVSTSSLIPCGLEPLFSSSSRLAATSSKASDASTPA